MVSLQKLYFAPGVSVTVLLVPTFRCRVPQVPVDPSALCPLQQADDLLPLTRSTAKKFESLLFVATSPWFTGGSTTSPDPPVASGLLQLLPTKLSKWPLGGNWWPIP